MFCSRALIMLFVWLMSIQAASAQSPQSVLKTVHGEEITTARQWLEYRPRLLADAKQYIYGTLPPKPRDVTFQLLSDRPVLEGRAREILGVMLVHRDEQTVAVRFGIVKPTDVVKPAVIIKNDRWLFDLSSIPDGPTREVYVRNNREQILRTVLPEAIDRGFAICKFVRTDLAADAANSRETGVLAMYPEYTWGSIAAWAWGYQPLIDYLIEEHGMDRKRIISTGHSRGGKTALAAAIFDERIAIAAPSASGSGGTGSWEFFTPDGPAQTPEHMVRKHEYWFSPNLKEIREAGRPRLDGHHLRALVAPRGIINTQGVDDGLSNPRGTRLMFEATEPVYELLGRPNSTATSWRSGTHNQTVEDWQAVFDYAESYFNDQPVPTRLNNWPESSKTAE